MALILELIDNVFLGYFQKSFYIGFSTLNSSSPCNCMPFSEYPSLYWVNPNNFKSFIHSALRVQLKVVTKVFLSTLENKKWIKQLKLEQQILFLKTWDFFYLIISLFQKRNREIILLKSNMGFLQQAHP